MKNVLFLKSELLLLSVDERMSQISFLIDFKSQIAKLPLSTFLKISLCLNNKGERVHS